jgi:hypothetical protein
LIDKITILEITAERIADPGKRRNVLAELKVLLDAKRSIGLDAADVGPFANELKSINLALWDIGGMSVRPPSLDNECSDPVRVITATGKPGRKDRHFAR